MKAFFVSCSKIPHVPTYDGHFERLTISKKKQINMKTNKNNYPTYPSTPNFIQERNFLKNKKKNTGKLSEMTADLSFTAQVVVMHRLQ